MSGYLLDTPVITSYLRGQSGAVTLISPWIAQKQAGTSIIVYGESIEYLRRFTDPQRWQIALRAALREMSTYRLTYGIMERYADLRRAMRPPYGAGLIGDMDFLIAATAFEHNLTMVTLDGDYMRVPGLSVMRLDRDALR